MTAVPPARRRIAVAAAVILDADGRFLLAQRPEGKPYPGYWEFPGGKIEPGETPRDALVRELEEELGIRASRLYPWITRDYDYTHAAVRLHFFRVAAWSGELHGREGQAWSWQPLGAATQASVSPMLPANAPVLSALEWPSVMGVTPALVADFLPHMERALAGGLRLVQLRDKGLKDGALGRAAADLACAHGARLMVNAATPGAAAFSAAGGVHWTARELMAAAQRPLSGWCGASCHDEAELAQAARLGLDYVVLGHVQSTPSHPGAQPLGWERFGGLIRDYPLPVYAIGGLKRGDLENAWTHGAHGMALLRSAWE